MVAPMTYTIRYHYATYSGTRTVQAEDSDEAIAKVRAWVRKTGSLPMAYESYKVEHAEA